MDIGQVLGVGADGVVTDAPPVELAVGPERQLTALMVVGLLVDRTEQRQYRVGGVDALGGHGVPGQLVVRVGGGVRDVDIAVIGEVRVGRDTEQSAFALGSRRQDQEWVGAQRTVLVHPDRTRFFFGDQDATVG